MHHCFSVIQLMHHCCRIRVHAHRPDVEWACYGQGLEHLSRRPPQSVGDEIICGIHSHLPHVYTATYLI